MKALLTDPDLGIHNANLDAARNRLMRGQSYRDLSTVIVCPTRGGRSLAPKVVSSWFGLMRPMNQQVLGPMFIVGDEVGEAYCNAVDMILGHPQLRKYKYMLTLEDDVIPPPDGLLKLYESIESKELGGPWDVVGGLYWTKGPEGQPMIYGDPYETPKSFRPIPPKPETAQRAHGLGMGFHLFRLSMFKNAKLEKPYFKTRQEIVPGKGAAAMTQDLYFYDKAAKCGYRFACDTRVRCGHYDPDADMVW